MQAKSNTVAILAKSVMEVLAHRKESRLLPQVGEALKKIDSRSKNQNNGIVRSAVPLEKSRVERITQLVGSFVHHDVELKNTVDTKVLGGFKVELGDWVLDASLKSDFDNLQKVLLNK